MTQSRVLELAVRCQLWWPGRDGGGATEVQGKPAEAGAGTQAAEALGESGQRHEEGRGKLGLAGAGCRRAARPGEHGQTECRIFQPGPGPGLAKVPRVAQRQSGFGCWAPEVQREVRRTGVGLPRPSPGGSGIAFHLITWGLFLPSGGLGLPGSSRAQQQLHPYPQSWSPGHLCPLQPPALAGPPPPVGSHFLQVERGGDTGFEGQTLAHSELARNSVCQERIKVPLLRPCDSEARRWLEEAQSTKCRVVVAGGGGR